MHALEKFDITLDGAGIDTEDARDLGMVPVLAMVMSEEPKETENLFVGELDVDERRQIAGEDVGDIVLSDLHRYFVKLLGVSGGKPPADPQSLPVLRSDFAQSEPAQRQSTGAAG